MYEGILGGLPHAFKASVEEDKQNIFEIIRNTWNKRSEIIFKSVNHKTFPLVIEFIGWSRIDGKSLFKVINGVRPLGDYFIDDRLTFVTTYKSSNDAEEIEAEITLVHPTLISTLLKDKNKS